MIQRINLLHVRNSNACKYKYFSIKDVFKKIIKISLDFSELCSSTYRAEKKSLP